jgi:hypothetical protein
MTKSRYFSLGLMLVSIIQAISASAQVRVTLLPSQTLDFMSLDAAMSTIVSGQPYSAEGVTKITQTLADGTRIEREVRSKFYRDSAGRVRREQQILGLDSLLSGLNTEPPTAITIIDPVAGVVYSLDPGRKEGRRLIFSGDGYGRTFPAPAALPAPTRSDDIIITSRPSTIPLPAPSSSSAPLPAPKTESLGTRQIEGLAATGERTSTLIPTGRIGNDRPIEIFDERWVSSDLKVVILLRHRDPQTGEVEFRLTNIKRTEPSPDVFRVPSDIQIILVNPSRAPLTPTPSAAPGFAPAPAPAPRGPAASP